MVSADHQALERADVAFARQWNQMDWTDAHEVDVREDFVTPLLQHLGFARGKLNDIVREESFRLAESFLRVGRERIRIDYAPRVRLKRFFIIETKSPEDPIDPDVLLQALFYAQHPEVLARYVCLTNGRSLEVYRVGSEPFDEPVLRLEQARITGPDITALRERLGAASIADAVRRDVIVTLKETFLAEVDESALDNFAADLKETVTDARPRVRANRRTVVTEAWKKMSLADETALRKASYEELLAAIDDPISTRGCGAEVARRLWEAPIEKRRGMFDALARGWRGRVHGTFRVQALAISLMLVESSIDLGPPSGASSSVEMAIDELVAAARSYCGSSPLMNALCHLDNACIRVPYKLVSTVGVKAIGESLQAARSTMAAEDRLRDTRGVAHTVIQQAGVMTAAFWSLFKRAQSAGDIDLLRWQLERFEEFVDTLPAAEYPEGESSVISIERLGRGRDILYAGTWIAINEKRELVLASPLSAETKAFASMSEEDATREMPRPLPPPVPIELSFPLLVSLRDRIAARQNGGTAPPE